MRAVANSYRKQGRSQEAYDLDQRVGEIRYEIEDWNGALGALEDAVDAAVEPTDKARALLWLAMTHWQVAAHEHPQSTADGWYLARAFFQESQRIVRESQSQGELDSLQQRAAATICHEEAQQWIGRLSDQIQEKPNDDTLRLSRARLYTAEARWESAAIDWAEVIRVSKDNSSWVSARKVRARELANYPEVFRRVVELRPDDYSIWIGRGMYHAVHRQWSAAATAYARGHELCSHDDRTVLDYACVLLLSGDHPGYQRLCTDIAERAEKLDEVKVVCDMARTCAIGPAEGVNPEKFVAWAQRRLDADRLPQTLHAMGLAKYRVGQFEEAVDLLSESNEGNWSDIEKAQNWLVLAMSHFRMGREIDAIESLNHAKMLIVTKGPQDSPEALRVNAAHEWVSIPLLLREATVLIERTPLTIDELLENYSKDAVHDEAQLDKAKTDGQ
jgi:tetratricopeptide (TPR) repeat protein